MAELNPRDKSGSNITLMGAVSKYRSTEKMQAYPVSLEDVLAEAEKELAKMGFSAV